MIKNTHSHNTQEIHLKLKLATNRSGTEYSFIAYPIGSCFKEFEYGGIYIFVSYDNLLELWNIVYIGQTENLNARVGKDSRAHHKWNSFIKHRATHIVLLEVSDRQARLNMERELIAFNDTSCNITHANRQTTFSITQNLPALFGVSLQN